MCNKLTLLVSAFLLIVSINTSQAHESAYHDFGIHKPIFNLQQLGSITQGEISHQLWSDDYWAKYAGGLAYRYAEPGFWLDLNNPKPNDWQVPGMHVLRNQPAAMLIRNGRADKLSPAEKYDLLVGDANYSLTKAFIYEIMYAVSHVLFLKQKKKPIKCQSYAFSYF